jgi:hypothetical protein
MNAYQKYCIAKGLVNCVPVQHTFVQKTDIGQWHMPRQVNEVTICSNCAWSEFNGGTPYYLTCRKPGSMAAPNRSIVSGRFDGQTHG